MNGDSGMAAEVLAEEMDDRLEKLTTGNLPQEKMLEVMLDLTILNTRALRHVVKSQACIAKWTAISGAAGGGVMLGAAAIAKALGLL
jgi:hypothetical protein